jgi:hypothetical protein
MGLLLVELARTGSPGSDGKRVGVIGEDRPLSPELLALAALQAGAAEPVAALEVADPSLLAAVFKVPVATAGWVLARR